MGEMGHKEALQVIYRKIENLEATINVINERTIRIEASLNGKIQEHISNELNGFREEMIRTTATHSEKLKSIGIKINWLWGVISGVILAFIGTVATALITK